MVGKFNITSYELYISIRGQYLTLNFAYVFAFFFYWKYTVTCAHIQQILIKHGEKR